MKKVKTLNEDIIRKLIIETIDEVSLGEGRKKKVEEVELSDEEARAQASEPYPPENEPDQPNPNPLAHTKPFDAANFINQFKQASSVISNAVKNIKSDADTSSISAVESQLEMLLDLLPEKPKKTN